MPPDVDRHRDTDPPTDRPDTGLGAARGPAAADPLHGDDVPGTVPEGVERIADKIKALLGADR